MGDDFTVGHDADDIIARRLRHRDVRGGDGEHDDIAIVRQRDALCGLGAVQLKGVSVDINRPGARGAGGRNTVRRSRATVDSPSNFCGSTQLLETLLIGRGMPSV